MSDDADVLAISWPASGPVDPPLSAVREAVARALAEDTLPLGDITASLVPDKATAHMAVVAREHGIVAGRLCAREAFSQTDRQLAVDWWFPDGSAVAPGTVVAEVSGSLRSILTAERTALNFLCHLSGVATLARRYVDAVVGANRDTRVLDTRKTTPGLRALEKAAVRAGGAFNHRGNLSEAVLIKDNHLVGLSISEAVTLARRWYPGRLVEVECDHIAQVAQAVDAGAGAVLLDNMSPDEVAGCVALVRQRANATVTATAAARAARATAAGGGGAVMVEVSGGVTLDTAPAYAAAGADLVSVGALTHSAPALDLGLDAVGDSARGD